MNRKLVQNKKTLMCFSALQILAFHLWVQMFRGNQVELFLVKTAYIGVDMFFFLSAFSLASREITDIKKYYLSRLEAVYLKFVFFCILGAIVAGFSMEKLWKSIAGVELFTKGGGSFLWFLPAIMLFYLIFPWIQKAFMKKPWLGALVVLLVWFAVGFVVAETTKYKAFYIVWNRIPIFVLGALAAVYEEKLQKLFADKKGMLLRIVVGLLLCVAGVILLWQYGFKRRLATPLPDMYYVIAIPMVLGLVLLLDFIPSWKGIAYIGQATLEMYALQMIFGFTWANKIYKASKSAVITNILTFVIMILCSVLLSVCYQAVRKRIKK